MDDRRFDNLARRLVSSQSRRSLVKGLLASGAAVMTTSVAIHAQGATPEATPIAEHSGDQPTWLLTVDFDSVDTEPVENAPGQAVLTLSGVDPMILFVDN